MRFIKLVRYDFKNGIIRAYRHFLVLAGITAIFCTDYCIRFVGVQKESAISLDIFTSDLFFYIFSGLKVFNENEKRNFNIPAIWLLIMAVLFYFILNYAFKDLNGFGKHILINSKSRKLWLISKYVWIFEFLTFAYFVIIAVCCIFGLIFKMDFSLSVSPTAQKIALNESFFSTHNQEINYGMNIFMPYITLIALGIFQLTTTLIFKPMLSYILSFIQLITSTFVVSAFIPGNYTMFLRIIPFAESGFDISECLICSAVIIVFSISVGLSVFKRYNIIGRE